MQLPPLLLFFLFILLVTTCLSQQPPNPYYTDCAPQNYTCGSKNFTVSYPFQFAGHSPDFCAHPGYTLECKDDASTFTINISNKDYQVQNIVYDDGLLNVVDTAFVNQDCPQPFANTTINMTLYGYSDRDRNLTMYVNCRSPIPFPEFVNVGCLTGITGQYSYYRLHNNSMNELFGSCNSVVLVPMMMEAQENLMSGNLKFGQALQLGFYLKWSAGGDWCGECINSGGRCGYNKSSGQNPTCFCPQGPMPGSCNPKGDEDHNSKKLIIGITCGLGGFILAGAVWLYCHCRKVRKRSNSPVLLVQDPSSKSFPRKDRKELESMSFHGQTHLFSYEELVEATNCFDSSKELGDGGYGTVYKGLLRDGRVVAVKRLYETSYKRVEQFMNEVVILSRLRHPNLVTLYGSTSPNSPHLLLVYEFVSNGTLAHHLHDPLRSKSLPLSLRLSMAIDTATALSYLHSVDIIHRDIKTHNILVDNNFNVKVADFGLSRLFPANATHVSTAPQGTPGYLDPEYHRFYQLTDKSDVYSFGVVLMELIAARPAVDIERKPNEISLAMAAINKIQEGQLGQLVDPGLGFETDEEVQRVVTLMAELAFRCLQMDREMRPSIKEVLQGLAEIQCSGSGSSVVSCCIGGQCELAVVKEDARLLKNSPPAPFSPDSVMNKWPSRTTTPNSSGPGVI